jgi:hypothetical protein
MTVIRAIADAAAAMRIPAAIDVTTDAEVSA